MSLNRHSSSRRKFNQSKKRRRKSSESTVNYESLEERRLLAVDVGLNLNTEQFGGPPNLAGAVGPNHVVTVTNQNFKVIDKVTGDIAGRRNRYRLSSGVASRCNDAMPGAIGFRRGIAGRRRMRVSTNILAIVYDADTRRWFITSVGNTDVHVPSGSDGEQHAVLLGMSRTSNPTSGLVLCQLRV